MIIKARLRMMAASEIIDMIPREKIAEIKKKDASPMFKAFVIGHEGESRGNLIGIGNVIKRWMKSAIENLHSKIGAGLQLFHGHEATNETAGRVPIGEIVGKRLTVIKDRLSSIIACYIYPDYRNLPLDVASIEADLNLRPEAGRNSFLAEIDAITGVALGNSAIDKPGFPGATLLGQLQAFAKNKSSEGNMSFDFTIDDVKAFVKAENLSPSDLFGAEILADDPAVKGLIDSEKKSAVAGEYAHRKRTEEGFDKTRKDLEAKLKEAETEVSKLKNETVLAKVPDLFEKKKADRKFTERQVKFIQKEIATFKPEKADDLEKEFDKFLDKKVDDYQKIAKDVFGIDEKQADGKKAGGEPDNSKNFPIEEKYIRPETNPMIKTD